jgi:hypothetical protein
MESDNEVPCLRVKDEQTQLGFCIIFKVKYRGLCEISALWHSSEV